MRFPHMFILTAYFTADFMSLLYMLNTSHLGGSTVLLSHSRICVANCIFQTLLFTLHLCSVNLLLIHLGVRPTYLNPLATGITYDTPHSARYRLFAVLFYIQTGLKGCQFTQLKIRSANPVNTLPFCQSL